VPYEHLFCLIGLHIQFFLEQWIISSFGFPKRCQEYRWIVLVQKTVSSVLWQNDLLTKI